MNSYFENLNNTTVGDFIFEGYDNLLQSVTHYMGLRNYVIMKNILQLCLFIWS